MSQSDWLTRWVSRHPLKTPGEGDATRYTAEVMARVKRVGPEPAGAPARWAWPQIGLALAAVCAGVMLASLTSQTAARRTAERRVAETVSVLAQLEEPAADLIEPDLIDEAAELDEEELMRLAEAPSGGDEAWVTETLQLLDQLDEAPEDSSGTGKPSQEEWLQELEILDEAELTAES